MAVPSINVDSKGSGVLRIGYVTTYDPLDPHNWSGSGFHIMKALERPGVEVIPMGPLVPKLKDLYLLKSRLSEKISPHRKYSWYVEPAVLKSHAAQIHRKLESEKVDIIFSPGTYPLAYLRANIIPAVFWADMTFAGALGTYVERSEIADSSFRHFENAQRSALERASLAIFSSDWAANSALVDYRIDPGKVKVIPFGANVPQALTSAEVERLVTSKPLSPLKLLFIGTDWKRKGGEVAVQAAELLALRGIQVRLTIVGCTPALPSGLKSDIRTIGFLSKSSNEGRDAFDTLFKESHFLLLPSRAEAYGLVLCEASSYGVPSLASDVGGIPTIIRDGINGFLFNREENIAESMAGKIHDLVQSECRYRQIAVSSYGEYASRLNWDVAGGKVVALLEAIAAKGKNCPIQTP